MQIFFASATEKLSASKSVDYIHPGTYSLLANLLYMLFKINLKHSIPLFFVLSFFLFDCNPPNQDDSKTNKQNIKEAPAESEKPISTQIIIATSNKTKPTIGHLYGLEYKAGNWQITFDTIPCSIGKNGFAALDQKVEGDGKSPSGKFPIGVAFGYEKDIETDLEFVVLQDNHFWVSDTSSSLYNQLIDYDPQDSYSEKMRRKDHLYKYGIVIEYNMQEVKKGKGSAIFLHVERRAGAPTLGCIAISETQIKELIGWLNPIQKPLIIMGTQNFVQQILKETI